MPAREKIRSGRLAPWEAAEAALMGDLAVGIQVLGWTVPFGGAVQAMATVPFAAIALRHRLRAVIMGALAAGSVALVVGGAALSAQTLVCAALGFAVGEGMKRHWGPWRIASFAALGVGGTTGAIGLVLAIVFGSLRRLLLAQIVQSWHGIRRIISTTWGGGGLSNIDKAVSWLVAHWWFALPAAAIGASGVGAIVAWALAGPSLARMEEATGRHWAGIGGGEAGGKPKPLPAKAVGIGFRYPTREQWALRGIDLSLDGAGFTVVVGPNGSGKSTLIRILAGTPPTEGSLQRPGGAGLGCPGGTAVVFQRPESQVLATKVEEELSWGLGKAQVPDYGELLGAVGLGSVAGQETATLSGGQLQRLAVASALARRPSVLLSDEATAMLDPEGRRQLIAVLASLARDRGVRVVHVTHRWEEAEGATDALVMEAGRVARTVPPAELAAKARSAATADLDPQSAVTSGPADPVLLLKNVGFIHDEGTPWAKGALGEISFGAIQGEGIVICGPNGSGKTTLAWILAGLERPSEGEATLGGTALSDLVGKVGLSFQQSRLQLSRSTVKEEMLASAAPLDLAVKELDALGLPPDEYLDRRVDTLSGGEQRRVVLAAIAAMRPPLAIFDEPLAGLDPEATTAVKETIARLRRDAKTITITVSHETGVDAALGARRIELRSGHIYSDELLAASHTEAQLATAPAGAAVTMATSGTATEPTGAKDGIGAGGGLGGNLEDAQARPGPRRRGRRRLHMMRVLPEPGPLHSLWAGSKLIGVAMVGVAASFNTSWPSVAVVVALATAGALAIRLPFSVLPPLPKWVMAGLGATGLVELAAGGAPHIHAFGVTIGIGAVLIWARLVVLSLALLALSFFVGLSTPLGEVAPALSALLRPLGFLRLPIAEMVTTVSLSLRSLPLLVADLRMALAARKLHRQKGTRRSLITEASELLVTALVAASRRAREMGDALEARGGMPQSPPIPSSPRKKDAVFLASLAILCVLVASL